MITERHYDDAALIHLMESGLPDDPHVAACYQCSESLAAYRAIREVLGEEAVWDLQELNDEPVPQTIAMLRACATDMAREDAEADAILARLLAGPRESWLPRLAHHPEWRTAGVVRRLIAALDHALDTMPPDAVEMTALATEIADHLEPAQYPTETVLKLRGAAWRERGYALYYVGDFKSAMPAIDRADAAFHATTVDEYDLARVALVRSRVYRAIEKTTDAFNLARRAGRVFALFGDRSKQSVARETEALVLYKQGDLRGAAAIWHTLEQNLPVAELHTRGILLQNLAHIYRELGEHEKAQHHFEFAMDVFSTLGVESLAAKARWHAAAMSVTRGEYEKAFVLLSNLCDSFKRLGMQSEATLAALDLAEVLSVLGRYDEVTRICRDLAKHYEAQGLEHTRGALTAVCYLREAAEQGKSTPHVVGNVRKYIREARFERQFLFVPMPD